MNGKAWTVIYDGQCHLCTWARHRLERRSQGHPLCFVDGAAAAHEGIPQELQVAAPDGTRLGGFAALVVLWSLGSRWPRFWRMLLWPPLLFLGNRLYRWVARHRRRWFGQQERLVP
ncbi:MAG: DUF393 domain-containing protein [Thermoanaerobaculum sp.]|nr:DUF393 domain-containing protein [Thermoanaerobaculum sp.]MCX7895041.1 DUF393 domain-containing protein [Thermoanaerobaculum sp.]MDW7967869.1 DUF393 domain-containing protein [Thermoanaerobaculum sp.]